MRLISDYLKGQWTKAELCRLFGISRPTADKWIGRYQKDNLEGLVDRSRAPKRHPNQVTPRVRRLILQRRRRHPRYGPKKLRVLLQQDHPDLHFPALSTIQTILTDAHMVPPRKHRRRAQPYQQPFQACAGPNDLWCADYKGWFRTGDGRRCDPLTITDAYSRYLVRCQAVADLGYEAAREAFEAAFHAYGLPAAIRTDNGSPFASCGIRGLSRLSVWWMKLGIVPERIRAGHPQENGRHERMHRTLKAETAQPPAQTVRGQQQKFHAFRRQYNSQRPHESLNQQMPGSLYVKSNRVYKPAPEALSYPAGTQSRRVQGSGEFYWHSCRVFLGEAFGGELVGLTALDGPYWLLAFGRFAIGILDGDHGEMLGRSQLSVVAPRLFPGAEDPCAALRDLLHRGWTVQIGKV